MLPQPDVNQPLQLHAPGLDLTAGDEEQLQRIFSMPIVRRYLEHLLWDRLVEQGNMPITTLIEEQQYHMLRVAYIKGGIGILQTLISIASPGE